MHPGQTGAAPPANKSNGDIVQLTSVSTVTAVLLAAITHLTHVEPCCGLAKGYAWILRFGQSRGKTGPGGLQGPVSGWQVHSISCGASELCLNSNAVFIPLASAARPLETGREADLLSPSSSQHLLGHL
ncbi:hypothetical protein SRHO_G00191750 [Serrasalmus rhombeus]